MANKLHYQISQAKLGRSSRTQKLHQTEAHRFADELKALGYGVSKWENLTNKHIGAVVDSWKERGLEASTIKSYLSGVRAVAEYFGNDRIHADNDAFGVEQRVYVTNESKAVPDNVFEGVREKLQEIERAGNGSGRPDPDAGRVLAQMQLQREFGLRREESYKLNPNRDLREDGSLQVIAGTKGGRPRVIDGPFSDRQKAALENIRQHITRRGSSIPVGMREEAWRGKYDRLVRQAGLTKERVGCTSHGLRHKYAQQRYTQLSGLRPPCTFDSKQNFQEHARELAGNDWRKVHADACLVLKSELGHGPERLDVVSQYIGSTG